MIALVPISTIANLAKIPKLKYNAKIPIKRPTRKTMIFIPKKLINFLV